MNEPATDANVYYLCLIDKYALLKLIRPRYTILCFCCVVRGGNEAGYRPPDRGMGSRGSASHGRSEDMGAGSGSGKA
jgi:hypothetical protein